MRSQSDKTKVVVRHLPPTITQTMLMEQIDVVFSGRYNWVSFRPGKSSQKHQLYSRAYIDFKSIEDVIAFAEFFNGHVFVNEKGAQYKAVVEYAPSQRVPKPLSKKDAREGTILKDPEYLEFLESIAKPAENLPSAEIQLERREAERAGAAKEAPIVTPLMEFVRQRRAAKSESRRILSNGKLSRRSGSSGNPGASSSKRGSDKKKASMKMYVQRETGKSNVGKEKSPVLLVARRDDQQHVDKAIALGSASGTEVLEDESGSGTNKAGKKKILLLKGKEKEILPGITSSDKNANTPKQSRREGSGRMIRSILLNKDSRQSSGVQSEHQNQTANLEKEKRPPRPPQSQLIEDSNGAIDDKILGNDLAGFSSEKQEKRTRSRERPDRVVWTPLRRSDGSFASDEFLSSSASLSVQSALDGSQGNHADSRRDISNSRGGEPKIFGSGRSTHLPLENGSHKHYGRRGSLAHNLRETDGSSVDGKQSKRSGASAYGSHDQKQMWVQKSSSGS